MTLSEQIVNLSIVQESLDAARARQTTAAPEGVAVGMEVGPKINTEVAENTESTEQKVRPKITDLKDAPAELRFLVVALAGKKNYIEVADELKKYGVKTSAASVSRYLRKWKAQGLVEEGEDIDGAAEKLAEMGRVSSVREGSIQAVRQKIFQQAMELKNPEEGMRMFEALTGEEARLRKLALEERKVRAQERVVAVQERQVELKAAASGGLFLEALKILRNEQLRLEERVEMVMGLERRREGREAIEVAGEKLLVGEGKG